MIEKVSKNICTVFLFITIIAGLLNMLKFADEKKGFFCDEVYSYGLSNSVDYTFLDNESAEQYSDNNGWVDADYFKKYVTVSKDEIFSFSQTWVNQKNDVLPPLYYVLFHIASSFTPDTFTKWTGICFNFVFYFGCLFFIYKISRLFVKKECALFACALWSCSAAGINTVLYIRMYCMLAFIVLAFIYVLFKTILQDGEPTKRQWIYMYLLIAAGVLTHYYFIVFLAIMAMGYLIYMLINKKYKLIRKYIILIAADVCTVSAAFYPIYLHLFGSYRAKEAKTAISGNLIEGFLGQLANINRTLFGGALPVFIIIGLVTGIWGLVSCVRKKKMDVNALLILLLTVTVTGYVYIIGTVAPYHDFTGNRYIYIIYPIICILVLVIINLIPDKFKIIAMLPVIAWCGIRTINHDNIPNLNYDMAGAENLAAETSDYTCIFVYDEDEWTDPYTSIQLLMKYDNILFVNYKDLSDVKKKIETGNIDLKGIVLYWPYSILYDEAVEACEYIKTQCGLDNVQNMFVSAGYWFEIFNEEAGKDKNTLVYRPEQNAFYQYDNAGETVTGEYFVRNEWYYFDETGAMAKGPVILPDGRRVFYSVDSGIMLRGQQVIDEKEYYFDVYNGKLLKGPDDITIEIDGLTCVYKDWKLAEKEKRRKNGLLLSDDGEYHFYADDEIMWDYSGLAIKNDGWWLIKNSNIDTSYTGWYFNGSQWVYIMAGHFADWYTGMVPFEQTYMYIEAGVLQDTYCGAQMFNGRRIAVTNGVMDNEYTGLYVDDSACWLFVDGDVAYEYTGIYDNGSGLWYIRDGKIDFEYSGIVEMDGTQYNIQGGAVVGNTND